LRVHALLDCGSGIQRSDQSRILLEFPSDLSTHRSRRRSWKDLIIVQPFAT
jgi:hypothetical protein